MKIVMVAATTVLIGCGGGNGDGGGELSGEGLYRLTQTAPAPALKASIDITKTVLFHSLTQVNEGGECFYAFRILPEADQLVPDDDPFAQYIDVFYGNVLPGSMDSFWSEYVDHNQRFSFQGVPTRSPAEPSDEPLATGTYNNLDTGESGTFEFSLEQDLSMQLPEVTDCIK
jgi:hypothetical protein